MKGHTSSPAAHSRAVTRHIKINYDRIEIKYKKETKMKQKITEHAAGRGESVQSFIQRAILETMENDNKKTQCKSE